MARRRYRHRRGLGDNAPGSRSGVGFVVFGGLAVAAGAVFLIARSAGASTPPKYTALPIPGLPASVVESYANQGPGHF